MLQVEIKVQGTSEAIANLAKLNVELLDYKEALTAIGKSVTHYFANDVFATQGGALGVVWPTLAASTVKEKIKHYPAYANSPLVRSGAMQQSFTYEASSHEVVITNDAPYFKYHQSTEARSKIPRRAMMGINEPVKTMIKTILEADVALKVRSL